MSTSASVSPSRGAPRPTAAAPEALRRHVAALLASTKPGLALPGPFFSDDTLYAAELEYIFGRHWLFVASEATNSQRRPKDRKSTRLNSSHLGISYAVFCLKKKLKENIHRTPNKSTKH